MSPFAQLVSPHAQAEAVAASAQLRQLPGRAYRPLALDNDHGQWTNRPTGHWSADEEQDDPSQF
jgi:hypothetical protein